MKKLLLIAMLIPMTALATKLNHVPPPTPPPDPPAVTADSTSSSNSSSSSSSASDASGGSSSLNQTIKSSKLAPAVFSSGTNNNVPCHGEWHAGASVLVGGISYGRDRKDKDCLLKTAADDQYGHGNYRAAALLYCRIPYYVDALGKECVELLSVAPADATITLNADGLATKDDLAQLKRDVQDTVERSFRVSVGK